ncbi:MAG: glycogen debranching protein GlgX [Pseudomonadota bacterium]|nr:glycogen debranching protein GlgX [Pseudomonadota bacterium]
MTKAAPHHAVEIWPGAPYPLGATLDDEGVNFAIYSRHAQKVELCLFDAHGKHEVQRIALRERTDFVWHGYLPGLKAGALYGYRVHGPYEPDKGHRFNPQKLLVDPYAKAIVGDIKWSDAHFGYTIGHRKEDLSLDRRDSAPGMPRCQVVDDTFDWEGDFHPIRSPNERVIYEMHVGGYTRLHPDVSPQQQGKFGGLCTQQVIDHLKSLGVTTLELLPVHAIVDDRALAARDLKNYWGYNTLGFFAPDPRFGVLDPVREFKKMVKALHENNLEVVLDVVYNHTGEGNARGPTLSFRGIDNYSYYWLADDKRHTADFTGCGNSLDLRNPRVLQLVVDSLRYWVTEMHVDGFRFDLASTLGRHRPGFDVVAPFFAVLRQDPVLSPRLLIAEPWDLGDGGYQVGRFPPGWAEWNDQYRDTMRAYWKGDGGLIGDFARRLTGSHDLFGQNDRGPGASVNFITAHDGFTLHDLVSYNDKHNATNGEDSRDGTDKNLSWNYGAEGPTDDPEISRLRERQKRNFLATLLLSQGVPMITAGDEVGRTQKGNNNAYCQDNEINWHDWYWDDPRWRLLDFTKKMIRLRKEHPIFRRRDFFKGVPVGDQGRKDVAWLKPDGSEMTTEEWEKEFARSLGMWLNGEWLPETDERGRQLQDSSYLVLFNAHHDPVDFKLPDGFSWRTEIDTAFDTGEPPPDASLPQGQYSVQGRSLVVLRQQDAKGP